MILHIAKQGDKVLRMVDLVTVRVHGQDGSLLVETVDTKCGHICAYVRTFACMYVFT